MVDRPRSPIAAMIFVIRRRRAIRLRAISKSGNAGLRRNQRPEAGDGLTQSQLYAKCKELELKQNGHVRLFALSDQGKVKEAITRIEHDGPTDEELSFICEVLDLPASFFGDLDGFTLQIAEDAATQWWSEGKITLPERPSAPLLDLPSRISGFQRVFNVDLRPSYRAGVMKDLEQFTAISARSDPVLFILEGRKGVGKSFLVSQWYWGTKSNFPTALRIDCSKLSLDQIFPLTQPYFAADQRVPAAQGLGCLLVIDGLQAERDRDGLKIRLPNRLAHVDEVIEHVNRIFREIGKLAVILVIENNERRFLERREVFDKLAVDAGHLLHRLEPLDQSAGAEFLLENGLGDVAEPDRRKLSNRLHGLPLALVSAAEDIRLLDPFSREAYLADLIPPSQRGLAAPRGFNDLFQSWLHRLGNEDVDHWRGANDPGRAHPHALLRLLALLSGPVTHQELEEIISAIDIPRLSGRSIDYLRHGELPFVLYIDDSYDLHMLVRQALRDDLQLCLDGDKLDQFTSRTQLEAIHWQAARMRLRSLVREDQPDANCVRFVEAFVGHMVEQIRLIPTVSDNRRTRRPVRGYSKQDLNAFDAGPGKLPDGKLWWLAFHEARRFLVDTQKASTRVHGQFEAKARILARMLDVANEQKISIELGNIDVLKEISLCWMHAGRLQLALKAIEGGADASAATVRGSPEPWLRACDRVAIEVAIKLRLGRPIDELEDLLEPFLARATELALQAPTVTSDAERMPARERGALRILSRAAEVAQAAGEDMISAARFEQGIRLRACWHPRIFNGEAARRFSVALVRSKAMQRATALVTDNIALYEGYDLSPDRKGSNDIVGFLVLEAALARVAGKFRLARMLMLKLEQHPFVRRREITFVTRAEYELETLRLDFMQGHDSSSLLPRARQLSERMKASDHLQLYFDVEVLIGELLGDVEREPHCDRLHEQLTRVNHRMRERDISLLRQGNSPTRQLGL